MTDPELQAGPTITDPASVLLGLGAIAAILAAPYWLNVARSPGAIIDPRGTKVRSALGTAAYLTAAAAVLTGVGYLLGRFTGRF